MNEQHPIRTNSVGHRDDQINSDRRIDLSLKSLDTIPENLVQFSGVTILIASFNRLRTLPSYFAAFTSLLELDLRLNEISEFPVVLTNLPQLEVLDLRMLPVPLFVM